MFLKAVRFVLPKTAQALMTSGIDPACEVCTWKLRKVFCAYVWPERTLPLEWLIFGSSKGLFDHRFIWWLSADFPYSSMENVKSSTVKNLSTIDPDDFNLGTDT